MIECDEDGVDAPIIKKIDYSRLTNFKQEKFDSKLMKLAERECPNLTGYYVPYFWGSLGIMYNTDNLTEEQVETIRKHGWAVLFEPELLGDVKIAMYASARDSIASALLYKGYSINTKDEKELEEAQNALANMNYVSWATDELKTGVASGKYDVALVYSGDYFDTLYSVYEESDDPHISFDMYAPQDRNNVFFDAMVIPNNSLNEDLAYKFIDYMLSYDNALQNASYVGYCPTQKEVFDAMYEDPEFEGITDLEVYYPGNIDVNGGEIYKYLGTKVYELYDVIYKKVKK
jgi:spermidine/putrescine-binding protein